MRTGLRLMRRLLGQMVILVVALGLVGYLVYAANGIWNEVQARDVRSQHDELMPGTAAALAQRLTDMPLIEPTAAVPSTQAPSQTPPEILQEIPQETPTEKPSETSAPTVVAMVQPTETPRPSDTATERPTDTPTLPPTVTLIPTNTPRPAAATLIPTNTLRPSATASPSSTPTGTNTPLPTLTYTPSRTPTPTQTLTPSPFPTATYVIEGTYAVPYYTPVVEIPPRVPLMEDSDDIVNILLLGSDTTGGGVGHTDVIILVSINKAVGSVAMWHIPRDLFVYIPNYTMDRINQAYALGEMNDYPGGGFGLMKETILYNMGIEVDHYARVDFDDFMTIVEKLGGLEVSIDCAIEDWRLIDPTLDKTLEESYERYLLPIGRQTLTPYMALWYVRSRVTTNDLDRGRRQMDVLRAMWHQALQQGLFTQVTQLWPEAVQVVETDMTLTDVLSFVPLAVSLDMSNIARYSGTRGEQYVPFLTPDDGRDVVLPDREKLVPLIQNFLTPPTENRLGRQAVTVDIVDASSFYLGFDAVAADRLAWEGFVARPLGTQPDIQHELTMIYDYTGQTKGSELDVLKRVLRVSDVQVVSQPDPNRTVDYRVEIGGAYNSCVYGSAEDEAGPPINGN